MPLSRPLITVSIPVYKCEKYIERCLRSVFEQCYPNIEILLVNDQTPDNSLEIIHRLIAKNPGQKIRILHNKTNSGLSVVRNRGILEAEGEFLYFLDSDDEITPDCIQLLFEKQQLTRANMVVGANKTISTFTGEENSDTFPLRSHEDFLASNERVFTSFMRGDWPVIAPNKLLNVDYFRKKELYFVPGLYSQDELWSFHVALKLDSIAFVREFTYHYFLHSESVIHNRSRVNFDNYFTILQHFADAYNAEKEAYRKREILKKIVEFKEMVLVFLWKTFPNDRAYFTEYAKNYSELPALRLKDYSSSAFDRRTKLLNLYHRLPPFLHYLIFKRRFTGRF